MGIFITNTYKMGGKNTLNKLSILKAKTFPRNNREDRDNNSRLNPSLTSEYTCESIRSLNRESEVHLNIAKEVSSAKHFWNSKNYKEIGRFRINLGEQKRSENGRPAAYNTRRDPAIKKIKAQNPKFESKFLEEGPPPEEKSRKISTMNEEISGYISCGNDRVIGLWKKEDLELVNAYKSRSAYLCIIQLFNGQIAGGKSNGEIELLEIPNFSMRGVLRNGKFGGGGVSAMEQLNDRQIVSGGGKREGDILVWDLHTHQLVHIMTQHTGRLFALKVSLIYLFSGSNDGQVIQWDIASNTSLQAINVGSSVFNLYEFPPDLYEEHPVLLILNAGSTHQLIYWDLNSQLTYTLSPKLPQISASCALSPNIIVLGNKYGLVAIYNIRQRRIEKQFQIHDKRVVNIHNGGKNMLVTSSWDKSVKIIDLNGNILAENYQHFDVINDLQPVYQYES